MKLYMSHGLNSSTGKLSAKERDRRGVYRLKGIYKIYQNYLKSRKS